MINCLVTCFWLQITNTCLNVALNRENCYLSEQELPRQIQPQLLISFYFSILSVSLSYDFALVSKWPSVLSKAPCFLVHSQWEKERGKKKKCREKEEKLGNGKGRRYLSHYQMNSNLFLESVEPSQMKCITLDQGLPKKCHIVIVLNVLRYLSGLLDGWVTKSDQDSIRKEEGVLTDVGKQSTVCTTVKNLHFNFSFDFTTGIKKKIAFIATFSLGV